MQVSNFNLMGLESRFLKTAMLFAFLLIGTAGVLIYLITEELAENLELSLLQNTEVRAYQLASVAETIGLMGVYNNLTLQITHQKKLKADLNAIYGQDDAYLFCIVQDIQGAVVFKDSTGAIPEKIDGQVLFKSEVSWLEPMVSEYILWVDGSEKRIYQVAVAIVIQDQLKGVLKLGVSLGELAPQIESLANTLVRRHMFGGLLFLVIGVLAVWQTVRLMREAHRLEVQAKETDRLVFLGTIASGLAHEIRNPLNAISVDSELLVEVAEEMGGDNRSEIVKLSMDIGDSVRYLNATLTSFLQYARPSSFVRVNTKPKTLVLETVRLIGRQCARQGILLEWEAPEGLPEVYVDVPQMKQAILNLLINAQQAMLDGGVLGVHIRAEEDAVWIDISDTGVGISKADQARVFGLFYSTKVSGSGLGLAIARRIVEVHGGRLVLQSEAGEGTTFMIRLPLQVIEEVDDEFE
jgi:signal transduction histidine kinase